MHMQYYMPAFEQSRGNAIGKYLYSTNSFDNTEHL